MLPSESDLLSDLDGIVDLDPKVAHCALDLRMSKQELDGEKSAGSSVPNLGRSAPSRSYQNAFSAFANRAQMQQRNSSG